MGAWSRQIITVSRKHLTCTPCPDMRRSESLAYLRVHEPMRCSSHRAKGAGNNGRMPISVRLQLRPHSSYALGRCLAVWCQYQPDREAGGMERGQTLFLLFIKSAANTFEAGCALRFRSLVHPVQGTQPVRQLSIRA